MGAVRTDSDMCCMAPGPIQFVLPHPMMGLHAPRPEKLAVTEGFLSSQLKQD